MLLHTTNACSHKIHTKILQSYPHNNNIWDFATFYKNLSSPQVKLYLTPIMKKHCILVASQVVQQFKTKFVRKIRNARRMSKLSENRA